MERAGGSGGAGRKKPKEVSEGILKPLKISREHEVREAKVHGKRRVGVGYEVQAKKEEIAQHEVEEAPKGEKLSVFYDSVGRLRVSARKVIKRAEAAEGVIEKFGDVPEFKEAVGKAGKLFKAQKNVREGLVNQLLHVEQAFKALEKTETVGAELKGKITRNEGKESIQLAEVLKKYQEVAVKFEGMMEAGKLNLKVLKEIKDDIGEMRDWMVLLKGKTSLWEGKDNFQKAFSERVRELDEMVKLFNGAVKVLSEVEMDGILIEMESISNKELEELKEDRVKYFSMAMVGVAVAVTAMLVGLLVMSGVGAIVVLAIGGLVGGAMVLSGVGLGGYAWSGVSERESAEYQAKMGELFKDAGLFLKELESG